MNLKEKSGGTCRSAFLRGRDGGRLDGFMTLVSSAKDESWFVPLGVGDMMVGMLNVGCRFWSKFIRDRDCDVII